MTEQDWVSVSHGHTHTQRMRRARHIMRLLPRAIIFAVLITSGCGLFNNGSHDWSASFDGQAGQAHQLADGGYILADRAGCRLLRTDSSFGLMWSVDYDSFDIFSGDGDINSVLTASDGGYLVAGSADSGSGRWACRTDSSGNMKWGIGCEDMRHSGGHPNSTCRTADGSYVTTGGTLYDGKRLIALYEFTEGYTGWLALDGYGCGDWVVQTNDRGYVVACSSPAQLCRFDSAGALVRLRSLHGVVDSISYAYLAPGGECVIADAGTPPSIAKLSIAGNQEWQTAFDKRDYTELSSVQPTSDGGFILAGTVNGPQQHDVALIKIDSVGAEEWSSTFGGAEDEYGEWAEQTPDGGYVVTGTGIRFDSMEVAHYSILVKKTDAHGN